MKATPAALGALALTALLTMTDRARADRKRNAKLHERIRIREFRKVTQQHAPKSIGSIPVNR